MRETLLVEVDGDEGDVGIVHGLELDPFLGVAVEVGIGDELADAVEDALEHRGAFERGVEHGGWVGGGGGRGEERRQREEGRKESKGQTRIRSDWALGAILD